MEIYAICVLPQLKNKINKCKEILKENMKRESIEVLKVGKKWLNTWTTGISEDENPREQKKY